MGEDGDLRFGVPYRLPPQIAPGNHTVLLPNTGGTTTSLQAVVQYGSDLSVGLCRYATSGCRGWQDPYGPFLYGFGVTLPGQRRHVATLWLVERGSRWRRDDLDKEIEVLLVLSLNWQDVCWTICNILLNKAYFRKTIVVKLLYVPSDYLAINPVANLVENTGIDPVTSRKLWGTDRMAQNAGNNCGRVQSHSYTQ